MIGGSLSGRSWLHRLPARLKLAALALLTIVFFAVDSLPALIAATIAALAVYAGLGRPALARLSGFRPLLPLLVIIGALQFFSLGWVGALVSVSRLALMILLADLVTATTPMLAMIDAIAPLLKPLRLIGLDERRIALAFALVLRFMPVLLDDWRLRDEAWRARTGRRASFRLLAPWAAGLLPLADRVAEALDARSIRKPRPDKTA